MLLVKWTIRIMAIVEEFQLSDLSKTENFLFCTIYKRMEQTLAMYDCHLMRKNWWHRTTVVAIFLFSMYCLKVFNRYEAEDSALLQRPIFGSQTEPYAHSTKFDASGKLLIAADLGIDGLSR